MAKFEDLPRKSSEEFLSYERWSRIVETIFRETFVDQVRAFGKGVLEKEVAEIYTYFQNSEGEDGKDIRDDVDIESLPEVLGHNFPEMKTDCIGDQKQRLYQLAKLCVFKAHSLVTSKHDESSKIALHQTDDCGSSDTKHPPQNRKLADSITRLKTATSSQRGQPAMVTDQANQMIRSSARAFSIRSNADLRNLRHYSSPRHAFYKTRSFEKIKNEIIGGNHKIVHIYGMSGSGKSQIAMSVCKELDFNYPNYLIWHLQCQPNGAVILQGWQTFVNKLQKSLCIPNQTIRDICSDLQELHARSFVCLLHKIEFATLLVVEDVSEGGEKELLRRMIADLVSSDVRTVQLVIATQKLDALYSLGDIKAIREYLPLRVAGFEEVEAIDFLQSTPRCEEVVMKLAQELAYSPLRLFLAKTFCSKFGISYEEYHSSLGKDGNVIRKEKEILKNRPELGKHTYEVIMKILRPVDPGEEDEMHFEVMKRMSFLNNSTIPDILLGAFLRDLGNFDTDGEHKQVKYLLHKLEEECDLAIRSPLDKSPEFGEQTVTIHNDILSAVRLSLDIGERREVVVAVLRSVIGLVGKENRFRTDNRLLFDMMNHMYQVADFAAQLIETDFNPNDPKPEDFDIQLCLSRLYEVLGFAATQTSGSIKDENFGKSVDYLWSIACYYTGHSILKSFFGRGKPIDKLLGMLLYKVGKDPVETAKKAYKRLREASAKIPLESVMKSCEMFFPITDKLLKDMRTKPGANHIDFDEMEKDLKIRKRLKEEHLETLREHGVILTPRKLRNVFLTECIASILHSRGRQVLYLKESISVEEQQLYEWYTDVGLELCKCLSKDTGTKTAFEYYLCANNKLPRMLHSRKNETDAEFWSRIENSRRMASQLKDVTGDFYEHSVYKLLSGTPYTVMNALKYLVKANTKLYKRPLVSELHAVGTAISECEQLYQIAKENACKFVVASNCMIHVGKYYAAIKEFEKAFQAFEDGFDYHGCGINSSIDANTNGFAWALYNYGRALYVCGGKVSDFKVRVGRFLRRYEALKIPQKWREDLDEVKLRIQTLVSGSENS